MFIDRANTALQNLMSQIDYLLPGANTARQGDRFVSNAIPQATNRVNFAINETLSELFDRSRSHSVSVS